MRSGDTGLSSALKKRRNHERSGKTYKPEYIADRQRHLCELHHLYEPNRTRVHWYERQAHRDLERR